MNLLQVVSISGDKVLPFYKNRKVVYVQRKENKKSAQLYGTRLNSLQTFLLMFMGIEPKGIEIIYIDENGKINFQNKPHL